jgi:anthranilate phosphoribosyltransferase
VTIPHLLEKLLRREHLSRDEAAFAIGEIMDGRASAAQIGALLSLFRMKGETVDELCGAAMAMRARMTRVRAPEGRVLVDTCGTGGDGQNTFNISTTAAFVAAAAGVSVAKHGNRAVSSRAGSADVLEALGLSLEVDQATLERCLELHGFTFLFAQRLHPAAKHAAGPRRELGVRTIFNLLGPLANPAGAPAQLLGVFDRAWLEPMAEVLRALGAERALVVHARDGLDEISPCAETDAVWADARGIRHLVLSPEDAGLGRSPRGSLAGGDAARNAAIARAVLEGAPGAARDAVVLNAGGALWIAGAATELREGAAMAARAIDIGAARETLRRVCETLREGRAT